MKKREALYRTCFLPQAIGAALALALAACAAGDASEEPQAATASEIRGGTDVPTGQLEAVVFVAGSQASCSGTLITDQAVLTAASCFCPGSGACATRGTVQFRDVRPVAAPATRTTVSMQGDVFVHPLWQFAGSWLTNDYALVRLDQRASSQVLVTPIPVSSQSAAIGAIHRLVGYGRVGTPNGDTCSTIGSGVKRQTYVELDGYYAYPQVQMGTSMRYDDELHGSCSGDWGGPAIDENGRVAGVASTLNGDRLSWYDPTSLAWDFLQDHACPQYDPHLPRTDACTDLCPCWPGEGDCDGDQACALGSCVHDIGPAAGLPAEYDACWRSEHTVALHDGVGYTGASQKLAVGNWGSSVLSQVGDNRVSSLKVSPGFRARLCSIDGGAGTCAWFDGNTSDIPGALDNNTSNVEVVPGVTVYAGVLNGLQQTFPVGNFGAAALSWVGDDQISSLVAAPGIAVRLCSVSGGGGDCYTFEGTVSDLGPLDQRTSNVEVIAGATVYHDAGFSGTRQTFVPGTYQAADLDVVGNNQISSLVVAPGLRLRVCSLANGGGDCEDFTGYVGHVGALNDRASYLQLTTL